MGRRWEPKAKSTTGFTKMIELTTPITEEQVRDLKVGDQVSISGVVYTGRDAVHKYLHEGGALPEGVSFEGSIIYHCGPVVVKDENGDWQVTAAGPTTSIREEPYQADIMKQFGVRGEIGKGGMGPKTLAGCAENGGVYLHGIGGRRRCWPSTSPRCATCISRRSSAALRQSGNWKSPAFQRWLPWTATTTPFTPKWPPPVKRCWMRISRGRPAARR